MKSEMLNTENAPAAIGAYSQAVKFGNLLFCSGQIPIDPETGKIMEGNIDAQTIRVMKNIEAVLLSSGANFGTVLKTTIFLTDIENAAEVNAIYGKYFITHRPARSTVAVKSLPLGALIEIEVTAFIE